MKRLLCVALIFCMLLSLCACGGKNDPMSEPSAPAEASQHSAPSDIKSDASVGGEVSSPSAAIENSDDAVDNIAWDQLESMGKIDTENGLFYVKITLPAEFAGGDVTQKSIDANAGENYTSGKLNEDGSITYKMTKKQHKAMLDSISDSIDNSLQEMVDSADYAFTKITHNSDFTVFDAHLSKEELGFAESFMVLGFYMYGGMYNIFTGKNVDNISVNFYSSSGKLIKTANSSDAKG